MIKLYPVLVANSVSKNIVPGMLKAIERFALIYKLDKIAEDSRQKLGISLTKVGKKIVMKEETDELLVNYLTNEILFEGQYNPAARHRQGTKQSTTGQPFSYVSGPGTRTGSKRSKMSQRQKQAQSQTVNVNLPPEAPKTPRDPEEERKMSYEKEMGKRMAQAEDATISIGQMDMKSLSLEPTWMKVDRVEKGGQRYTSIIGVKAVPMLVKSDASLASLLMFDRQVGNLMHLVIRTGRSITGFFYRLYARTLQKLIDPDPHTISGNPYKDIILKRTILSTNSVDDVFLVLNQADLSEEFAVSAKGIRKLQRLGWGSFCIADDVNRRLSFCMKEFQGMCQSIPYTMLYHTLEQAKVFEDLEDVRRTSASLFKAKIPFKKVIGESIAKQKLDEFSVDLFAEPTTTYDIQLLNEITYIDENLATLAKKVVSTPKQFITRVFKGNIQIPQIGMDKLLKIGRKLDPQFIKSHQLATRVLKNSLKLDDGVNEAYIDWAAFAIVVRAKISSGKDLMSKTKDVLMSVVPIFRKVIRKAKASTLNIPPEHRVEAGIGLVTIFALSTSVAFAYVYSIILSLKIIPHVEEVSKIAWGFISSTVLMIKKFFEPGTPDTQPEMITKFWSQLFQQMKSYLTVDSFNDIKDTLEKKLTVGEGAESISIPEWLHRETGMTTGELGLFILISIVGIVTLKWMLKR